MQNTAEGGGVCIHRDHHRHQDCTHAIEDTGCEEESPLVSGVKIKI